MPEISLAAESGRTIGSRSSGRLRSSGRIPGVVYGHGMEPVPVAVEGRALRAALTTDAGLNALLSLDIDGQPHLTMAREIQRHPVRGTVTHVDFQIVRRDEVMSADVPITLVGEAEDVARNDGVVEHQLFSLTINATPDRIPNNIEVDISGLSIGDAIRVGDLRLPDGVTTDIDPEEAVVLAQGSALAAEAEALAEEAAEAAEAEAGEGGEAEGGDGGGDGGSADADAGGGDS
ncbi:MAG: large subunit ribosomal protein [Acidimicrobiaceae bacterium]|nr:large subunit ribosomal protein [Acidimicrobiaceae bacterium]